MKATALTHPKVFSTSQIIKTQQTINV